MRIVVDLQGCQSASQYRGIGRYSMSLAQAMGRQAGSHEFWLLLNGAFPESVDRIRRAFSDSIPSTRIISFSIPSPVAELDAANVWRCRAAEYIRETYLADLKPEILHVSSLFEGLADNAVTSVGVLPSAFDTAVTLYDLIPLFHPEALPPGAHARSWYDRKLRSLKNANILLAISEYSRREAIEALGLPEQQIINISSAVDARFKCLQITAEQENVLRARYGLIRPFVMYTGGCDYRKNVEGLIEAFALLPETIRCKYQLAIVWKLNREEQHQLMAVAKRNKLDNRDVVFTGYVPDDDLVALYNLCALYVFPSLHEGFGLPALEAMACGAPVIGSNTTSIPEVIGWVDALFEPTCAEDITARMHNALTDASFRQKLREHGLTQAAKFSWDSSAKRVLSAFEEVHARHTLGRSATNLRLKRPRLAFVSPLPPARTGIASYSTELLPELAKHYEITLIVDQSTVDCPELGNEVLIHSVQWFEQNVSAFDRILYQFGNSPFHKHMFGLLVRFPGTVVLHDFFLSGVLNWMEAEEQKPGLFQRALYDSHGYDALVNDALRGRSYAKEFYPCNKDVLENASGVIVHSRYSQSLAKFWCCEVENEEWAVVHQHRRLPAQLDRTAARARLGLRVDHFLICSFGLLDPTKLNHRVLQAWLKSVMAGEQRCQLVFVGENHGGDYGQELLTTIINSPAAHRIRISGFVSPESYSDYLLAADLAVQLRAMSRGETSRAVLDCLAYGLPLIVNANGGMGEYPDDVLIKLPDEFGEDELISSLDYLYLNDDVRRKFSVSASNYMRLEHDPAVVADVYRDAIEQFSVISRNTRYRKLVESVAHIEALVRPAEKDWVAAAESIATNRRYYGLKQWLVDVSVLVKHDLRTGIERVVRAVLKSLLSAPPSGYRVEPIYEMDGQYRYARGFTLGFLDLSVSELNDDTIFVQRGDIFLGLDWAANIVIDRQNVLRRFRAFGAEIYFIVYDLLPALRPEFFPSNIEDTVYRWLDALANVSDGVVCISMSVADEFADWMNKFRTERVSPLKIGFFHLGADLVSSVPTTGLPNDADHIVRQIRRHPSFLMVGTVEPRKGHRQALEAFELLWSQGVNATLIIIGKLGWMMENLGEQLRQHPEFGQRLLWLEGISDEFLSTLYSEASVLLAASEGEGFGLPLIEAAQHGLPIIARSIPVFHEVAGERAYYFSGLEPVALAEAIQGWLTLREENREPSSNEMPWLTWEQSAKQLANVILGGGWYKIWKPNEAGNLFAVDSKSLTVDFSRPQLPRAVTALEGVSCRETWGRWSDGRLAESVKIYFKSPLPLKGSLNICGKSFGPNSGRPIIVKIGEFSTDVHFADVDMTVQVEFELPFPVQMIEIIPPHPTSPSALGLSNDVRRLGIGLSRLAIYPQATGANVVSNPTLVTSALENHLTLIHDARLTMVRSLLPAGDKILDLGGANAPLHRMGYPHRFSRLTMVDLPQDRRHEYYKEIVVDQTSNNGTVVVHYADMTSLDAFEDESVDFVWSGQSIEHVPAEAGLRMCQEARRVLKKRGAFCLDTPNRLLTEIHTKSCGGGFIHPEHFIEYYPDQLRKILEQAGFIVKKSLGICEMPETVASGEFHYEDFMFGRQISRNINGSYIQFHHCVKP